MTKTKSGIFKIDLGDEVVDKVTDYKGIIVSRSEWLTGCNTYGVRSRELKDGKPMDLVFLDEDSLTVTITKTKLAKDMAKLVKERVQKNKSRGGIVQSVQQTNK